MSTDTTEKLAIQKQYLYSRNKCLITQGAKYTTALNTDVKATMRIFLNEELPTMIATYSFLYK